MAAAPLERDRVELEAALGDDGGEPDLRDALPGRPGGLPLVGASQREQVLDEVAKVLRLVRRALHPAPRLIGDALVLQEYLRVGEYDGERGLELVRGIRDEATLLPPGALDRPQRPAREDVGDGEERAHRREEDAHVRHGLVAQRHVDGVGVEEGYPASPRTSPRAST